MPTYASTNPAAKIDGILYASSVPLTSTEADLFNGTTAIDQLDPIPTTYTQAIQAVVQLTPQAGMTGQNSYVVMQTDLGDGVWIDVAWCVYTNTTVNGIFLLSGGIAGNNAFQQSRLAGSFPSPQANGSNAMVLGSRVRFVGKTILAGGSSSSPGVTAGMNCTIRYRLLALN